MVRESRKGLLRLASVTCQAHTLILLILLRVILKQNSDFLHFCTEVAISIGLRGPRF